MKQELKELVEKKFLLKEAQKQFQTTLEKTFPYLEKHDLDKYKDDLNDELNNMLSACVKFKSARILISLTGIKKDQYPYESEVVLTQSPGLKYPHHSYGAFDFLEVLEIKENGDILVSGYRKTLVLLSGLKKRHEIYQEKLEKFLELLKKANKSRERGKEILTTRYEKDSERQKSKSAGPFKISMYPVHFGIAWKDNSIDSNNLVNFPDFDKEWERERDNSLLKGLAEILENFQVIEPCLEILEFKKKQLVQEAESILKELRAQTRGFKLLKKMDKNNG